MGKLLDVHPSPDVATPERGQISALFGRAASLYKVVALILFNTFVLIVLVNASLYVAQHKTTNEYEDTHSFQRQAKLFADQLHDFSRAQLLGITQETALLKFEYAPFVAYAMSPYSGKWINIAPQGFRRSHEDLPWPPDPNNINIFVFGPSTTFGDKVADDQTVPAYLQEFLRGKSARKVKVYNFAVNSYYTTPERIQFSNLLRNGFKPDVALFTANGPEFRFSGDKPQWTTEMRELFDERDYNQIAAFHRLLSHLPMTALAEKSRKTLRVEAEPGVKASHKPKLDLATPEQIAIYIHRFLENKRLIEAIANAYSVKTLFVMTPLYKFDKSHLKYYRSHPAYQDSRHGYEEMAKMVKSNPEEFGNDFLWLADLQERASEPLYLDFAHYRPKFSKAIAGEIGQALLKRELLADNDAPPVVRLDVR